MVELDSGTGDFDQSPLWNKLKLKCLRNSWNGWSFQMKHFRNNNSIYSNRMHMVKLGSFVPPTFNTCLSNTANRKILVKEIKFWHNIKPGCHAFDFLNSVLTTNCCAKVNNVLLKSQWRTWQKEAFMRRAHHHSWKSTSAKKENRNPCLNSQPNGRPIQTKMSMDERVGLIILIHLQYQALPPCLSVNNALWHGRQDGRAGGWWKWSDASEEKNGWPIVWKV